MKKNTKVKTIRLCVAGSPHSGKTFLIYSLVKMITLFRFRLTDDFPFLLQENTGDNRPAITDIKNDLTRNMNDPIGKGTTHSEDPGLWEYHYDNLLKRTGVTWYEDLLFWKGRDVSLQIKNIPGEMFSAYFKVREAGPTINERFRSFLYSDQENQKLIEAYKENDIKDEDEVKYIAMRTRFEDFLAKNLSDPDKQDLGLVVQNFFSYIFYYTCTDLIICHDVTLPSADSKAAAQKQFLNLFSINNQWTPKVYYAFTKFDRCIDEPETNYIAATINEISNYWMMMEANLERIYKHKIAVNKALLFEIGNIMHTHAVINRTKCIAKDIDVLEHAYFICTNYSNNDQNRGFFTFNPKVKPTDGRVWNDENYFNNYYPLGAVELLMALFHRNKICTYDELQIPLDAEAFPMVATAYGFINS